jgi:hypothetical protein
VTTNETIFARGLRWVKEGFMWTARNFCRLKKTIVAGLRMSFGVSTHFVEFLDAVCELLSGRTSGQVLNEEFERAIAPLREQVEQQRLRIDELQAEVVELRHLTSQLRRRIPPP